MILASLLFSVAFSGINVTVMHDNHTEQFSNCTIVRDSRMSDYGTIELTCPSNPAILPRQTPTKRPVDNWAYYIVVGNQVWARDGRCRFVENLRTWNYEKLVLSCQEAAYFGGDNRGPKTDS